MLFYYSSDTYHSLHENVAISLMNIDFFKRSAVTVEIEANSIPFTANSFSFSIKNCSFSYTGESSSFILFDVSYLLADNLSIALNLENLNLAYGGGKALWLNFATFSGVYHVVINKCSITNTFGSALHIWVGNNSKSDVIMKHSVISWNSGNSEAREPLVALLNIGSHKHTASFLINNVTLEFNSFYSVPMSPLQNMLLYKLSNVTMVNCTFKDNHGSALYLDTTGLTLLGTNRFINNTGYIGAALCIRGKSILKVSKHESTTFFVNNTVTHTGGAIHIVSSENSVTFPYDTYSSPQTCFIILEERLDHSCEGNCVFVFDNNMAFDGGDAIFGGNLVSNNYYRKCCVLTCVEAVIMLSDFSQTPVSQISSSPTRVCLCENSLPACLKYNISVSIFPGQTIYIPAFTVGQQFGTSRGSVFAQILNKSSDTYIPNLYQRQSVGIRNCSDDSNILQYKVGNPQDQTVIVLTAEETVISETLNGTEIYSLIEIYKKSNETSIPPMLLILPIYINISLLECPQGFELHKSVCDCATVLMKQQKGRYRVACDIDTQEITREYSVWVDSNNTTTKFSQHCPLLYCNSSVVQVNLSREQGADVQCINHHSGVLCGGCQKGFSLAIGSSNCLPYCSDNHLWLLFIFAIAGVVLVLLIKFLNLTITQGMISGLIFYANIIQSNKNVFLSSRYPGVSMFATFIAWLNMDFGIETCFSKDLDMYTKTWLQFVFPLYLWILAGGMILVCRYSRLATKFFGDNTVHVLATILLLSYNKLLITITTVYSSSTINVQNNNSNSDDIKVDVVWTYDGNVVFFSARHSFLFAVSTGVLLFLWLPFTLCVLLGQWLQRYNHYQGLRWLARVMPLFDAYYGPLKNSHRYWVGVLLLARVVVIVPAADPLASSSSSLLTLSILMLVLLFFLAHVGRVYRKLYTSLIEISYFINIAVLAIVSLYLNDKSEGLEMVVYISASHCSLALLLMLSIQLYHTLVKEKCQHLRDSYIALHEDNDGVLPVLEYER